MATKKAKKSTTRAAGKSAQRARRATSTASRTQSKKPSATRPPRAVVIGRVDVFGAPYKVVNVEPRLIRRELRGTTSDKADIRCDLGSSVRWSAPRDRPFRIEFAGAAPDGSQPERRSFVSRLVAGEQRVEVAILGHAFGTKLVYDIFSPPKADKPLDPSIIIEPNAHLKLVADH